MNLRQSIITLSLGAAVYGFALAASAQGMLDNDSPAFFRYNPSASASAARADMRAPNYGDVSPDGFYTYSGGERGWINRQHSYEFVNGEIVHSSDCLPYTQTAPARVAGVMQVQGPFADHGA